ncbi:MAG TPA: flagellar basal body-associated FliL family protein [Opitutus sp.]|nr:flagellar basal body-associated FliL family protein [Opitutus sp.]
MPAKIEPVAPTPAPAAAAAAATASASAAPAPEASPASGKVQALLFTLIPVVLAAVLAAAASWAVVEFVMIPRLRQRLAEPATAAPAPATAEHGKEGANSAKPGEPPSYEFANVVVNLAGTMGTRYLKTSFVVTGADPQIHSLFEAQKPRLTDVTIGVLSSLTLADLEEPGSKNLLREKLVAAYNQAFGHKVAEQVYFSDFVVQ